MVRPVLQKNTPPPPEKKSSPLISAGNFFHISILPKNFRDVYITFSPEKQMFFRMKIQVAQFHLEPFGLKF